MGKPRGGGGGGRGRGRGNRGEQQKSSEPELHAAARVGDLQKVESICSSNPLAVNTRDRHSRTPLHLAAWAGHTDVVHYLCKNKADVGAAAIDDTGAIHFASQKGHLDVVRVLHVAGASVKAANRKGLTPLHFAVQGSHLELIKYLVRKGADLKAKNKGGQTPMHLAESDEVRDTLKECEQLRTENESKSTLGSKTSNNDNVSESKSPLDEKEKEGEIEANGKRKGGEASESSIPEQKKPKISLQHLMSENDVKDEEEE
ncbi:Ankyrin repeat-containing protein [Rhynchospora pubera]|uniref:Ankyrin repeat-containing protein n=1 Tax=Rhynchospora pubera TaxID=906938 RepID=A0AAV8GJX8_9POAL|nr:Ankyrin repeat-containing protein [Rhynchospora pubera]